MTHATFNQPTPSVGFAIPPASAAKPKNPKKDSRLDVRWVRSISELEDLTTEWQELCHNVAWRNPSFEPHFLIPAIKHLSDGNVKVLVVTEHTGNRAEAGVLSGLIPFVDKPFYRLPIPCLEIWKHEQCCDTTPLLRKGIEFEVLRSACEFLAEEKIALVSMNTVSGEPGFGEALENLRQIQGYTFFQRDAFCRAACRPDAAADKYIAQFTSKGLRKKVRRWERRLAEIGEVEFQTSDDSSDFEQLAQDFLELEASGWKGKNGTALQSLPSTKQFYEELIGNLQRDGKVRFLTMKLDRRPIAMVCDIQSGKNVYAYKTAFDEEFATFSPGLQVELKNIETLHRDGIELADSCTTSDGAVINRIWGQTLQFQSVVIGLQPGFAKLAIRTMPWMQLLVKKLRRFRRGISN